ncbi:MAG TPA: dCMP deaminase family protein [Gammaproteobacteria bacterium]|nr:dCMP deaminase family protein [Gammaproteobacteria bacterium]
MSAWSEHFLAMAQLCAEKSKDPSTKVGAVIVGPDHEVRSTGYNDFPRGVADRIDERRERPAKYLYTEHAERNAIYNAARVGIPVKGCALYLNWEPKLCADCARAVIQAGIVRVIGGDRPFPGHKPTWEESCRVGYEMLVEAGVDVDLVGCGPRTPTEPETTFIPSCSEIEQ